MLLLFQAVIERQHIRNLEDSERTQEELEAFYLQVAQMVVIVVSLLSVYVLMNTELV